MWSIFAKLIPKNSLHNLHRLKQTKLTPSTPTKKESSSSSTKSKVKGLSQKERDLLEYLKDDPSMRKLCYKKSLTKKETQMMTK